MDFREKILREGTLKHRQTSYARPRWKTRYVVFKISGGGRLQFIIYKESPTSPANEVKEIPIEEYGGLESNTKVDSEKNVFSVITTNMTDTFATESGEDLMEWTQLLQEYLGKELTFGVTIPQKQGPLKSGRAILRIRNTGFTITTCDSPPRSMGTWQIIHIRKFGGTDAFKFQTGSKCPSGEMLYTLQTDDNPKVKALFNDLSQHKPIFSDDRVGRRMTLERNHNHHGPYRQSPSRFSLPATPGRDREGRDSPALIPTYENKEVITEAAQRYSRQMCPPPLPPTRRHSSNDDHTPHSLCQQVSQTSGSSVSSPLSPAKLDDQRVYQNIPGRPGNAPHSPTKHRAVRYPIPHSEPVPEGYYNVSPPLALKKYPPNSGTSPPRHSPDEDSSFFSDIAPVPPPPIKTVSSASYAPSQSLYDDAYVRYNQALQRPMVKIEGDNLVVQRTPNGHVWGPGGEGEGGKDETTMYQNLEFMNKKWSNVPSPASSSHMEDTHSGGVVSSVGQPLPIITDLDSQAETHSYTNVSFALESAHGISGAPRTGGSSKQLARAGDVRRKISAPPLNRDRSGAVSYRDTSTLTSPEATSAATPKLSLSLHPKLRPSLSSHDLQQSERPSSYQTDLLPEYYNLFVPRLPAHSGGVGGAGEGGVGTETLDYGRQTPQQTLSDFPTPLSSSVLPAPSTTSVSKHSESVRQLEEEEEEEEEGGVGGEGVGGGEGGTDMVDFAARSTPWQDKMMRVVDHSEEEEEEEDDDDDKVLVTLSVNAGHNRFDGNGSQTKAQQSLMNPQYDHLELIRSETGMQTTRFSPGPSSSPENLSRGNTPRPSAYDQLELKEPSPPTTEKKNEKEVCDEMPIPVMQVPTVQPSKNLLPYERKVVVVGHTHTYDYIDVMLRGEGNGKNGESHIPGPQVSAPRHNSDPGKSDSGTEPTSNDIPLQNHNRFSLRGQDPNSHSTQLQSRRKPLPLQTIPLNESFNDDNGLGSKGQQNEKPVDVPLRKPRKPVTTSSTGSDTSCESDRVHAARELSRSPVQPLPPRIPLKNAHQKNEEIPTTESGPRLSPPIRSASDNTTHKASSLEEVRSHEASSAVQLRLKDPSTVKVSLPVADIQFDKPLVPPKPRVLENKQALIQRNKLKPPSGDSDLNYTQVFPRTQRINPTTDVPGTHSRGEGSRDSSKVVYQSINFEVTEGLRKTREDVEHQRSREIEWLEQREQNMKTLLAK